MPLRVFRQNENGVRVNEWMMMMLMMGGVAIDDNNNNNINNKKKSYVVKINPEAVTEADFLMIIV